MRDMKIQIASDLHLEGRKGYMPERAAFDPVPSRDVLVLAGDIGTHLLAQEFVLRVLEISPVIYVPGNHEYYTRRPRSEVDRDWTTLAASEPDLHYLIAEGVIIDGVRAKVDPWPRSLRKAFTSGGLKLFCEHSRTSSSKLRFLGKKPRPQSLRQT